MARRAAGLVIFRRVTQQIEYLLLRASYGDFHWSSPKGHVDPGEDDFTTALRETKEEAGYSEEDLIIFKNKSKVLNYTVKGKPKVVVYWLAQLKNPAQEPKLSDEHTEMMWLPKDAAKDIIGYKENQEMIEEFHEFILGL
ncbi:bis(5'-nucleosyl)-tetraphosphatase [asymmetrical] [Anastrepha obliqua]|uniref:bis(5'-nucleosyl)-tetraphosphatase [asymmetrical] n=1 Tax=Anastrepha obliqua TaxID=95512 RepID=UPI002409D441|nr:bis(5'-nucleosyl)-tetraphosphatase [asymmetrical] [Anastrepha obliqua]